MRQVKLTKGNQEVIVTSSGEVSLLGRKLNIDIDFDSGKVKLYEMCSGDGNLTESIKFDTFAFLSNENTAFNESSKKTPKISGNTLLFEDIENCFCCLSDTDKTNINTINIDMRGQEYAYDTLLQANSILATLNEALSFDNSITVNFHAIDEEQYFLYLEMLRKLSNAKTVSILIENDEIPTTIVEDENNCKKLSFSSKENNIFIPMVLTILNSITKIDNLQKKEVLDEDGNVLYEYFVDRINLNEYVDFFNTYHYARYGYVMSGYFEDVAETANYSRTGYMQDGYVLYSVPLSKYEEVDIIQDGYVEAGYFKASNKIPFVQENVIELYSFSEDGTDYFDAGCNNFVIGSGSDGGSGLGGFRRDDFFDDLYFEENGLVGFDKWIKILKNSSIKHYEDGLFKYVRDEYIIKKVDYRYKIHSGIYKYAKVKRFLFSDGNKTAGVWNGCAYNAPDVLNENIEEFHGYPLTTGTCTNIYGSVRLEIARLFKIGDYPKILKNLKKVSMDVYHQDNLTDLSQSLIREYINGSIVDNPYFPVKTHYVLADLLEILSVDTVTDRIDGGGKVPNEPSVRTFGKYMPRPVEDIEEALKIYTMDMTYADKSFVYALADAMIYFNDLAIDYTLHISSVFDAIIGGGIYVSEHSNHRKSNDFPAHGEYDYTWYHFYYTRDSAENNENWNNLKWDARYIGFIGIVFENGKYVFKHPSLLFSRTKICLGDDGVYNCGNGEMPYNPPSVGSNDYVIYSVTKNSDGSIKIEWNNSTDIDAKFFTVNDKKIKIGV